MKTCVLLLGESPYNDEVKEITRKHFELKGLSELGRWDKQIEPEAKRQILLGVDYVFNFLSPVILPKELLENHSLNFHPGLPEYPGVGGASYALYDKLTYSKVKDYGATAHWMTEKVDSGPIIKVKRFKMKGGCKQIFDQAVKTCFELFKEIVPALSRGEFFESKEIWPIVATTRESFENWMDVTYDTTDVFQRKYRALKHPSFKGPYITQFGKRFYCEMV